jgi:hypothetical protein
MTKAEQTRLMAWRLRVLQEAGGSAQCGAHLPAIRSERTTKLPRKQSRLRPL